MSVNNLYFVGFCFINLSFTDASTASLKHRVFSCMVKRKIEQCQIIWLVQLLYGLSRDLANLLLLLIIMFVMVPDTLKGVQPVGLPDKCNARMEVKR